MAPFLYTVNMDTTIKLNNQQLLCVVKSAKEVADTILRLKNDTEVWSKMCANVKKCRMNFGRRNISREFFSHGLFN